MSGNVCTDDVFYDFYKNLDYKRLSNKEERRYIKRAKLSFYDEVDDYKKELFLYYYISEFPNFNGKYSVATVDEKEKLVDEAISNSLIWRDKFIENNQRLVLFVAKEYMNYTRDSFTLMDMIQEGNFGLMSAIETFDLDRETRFSTYAIKLIRQSIVDGLARYDKKIRIPVYLYSKINILNGIINQCIDNNEVFPSYEELSEKLDLSLDITESLVDYVQKAYHMSSLDMPVGEKGDLTLGDYVESNDSDFTIEVEKKVMNDLLLDIIDDSSLSSYYKNVIKLRYGIIGGRAHSLEEIGKMYGVSPQRIGQVERMILERLRSDKKMINYINNQEFTEISGDGLKTYKKRFNWIEERNK